MTYHTDPQECFDRAIFEGVLSDDPAADDFACLRGARKQAGGYMYIGTEGGADLFKHRGTRKYVRSPLI